MEFTNIIISQYASEKSYKSQNDTIHPIYSFIVNIKATKNDISNAFYSLYNMPAYSISTQIRKSTSVRNGTAKPGYSKAFKIAHISLEKGLKIGMTEEEYNNWLKDKEASKAKPATKQPKPKKAKVVKASKKKEKDVNKDASHKKGEHHDAFTNVTKKLRVHKIEEKDVKLTTKLEKQKEPYIITAITNKGHLVLKGGEIVTKEYVINEIDHNDQPFAIKTKNNLLITVHPKADIVDYVRTKPKKEPHQILTTAKVIDEKQAEKK